MLVCCLTMTHGSGSLMQVLLLLTVYSSTYCRHVGTLHDIISQDGYDELMRPNDGGPPVNISVAVFITSIHSLSEVSMDYAATIFLAILWTDPRFIFNGTDPIVIRAGTSMLDRIWTPDLYFVNVKDGHLHQVTIPNEGILIYPNGRILYNIRVSVVLICNLYLHNYPMDIQSCAIKMESFGYTNKQVRLNWNDEYPATIPGDLVMPEFLITQPKVNKTVGYYPHLGHYDRLLCTFTLHRELIYYILEHYIPSSLMVIVSWISFWLDIEAVPARASLGITTALTLATLSSSARVHIAKVSYTKYDDNQENQEELQSGASKQRTPRDITSAVNDLNVYYKDASRRINKYCRVIFPISFVIFNITYWMYYLYRSDYLQYRSFNYA